MALGTGQGPPTGQQSAGSRPGPGPRSESSGPGCGDARAGDPHPSHDGCGRHRDHALAQAWREHRQAPLDLSRPLPDKSRE